MAENEPRPSGRLARRAVAAGLFICLFVGANLADKAIYDRFSLYNEIYYSRWNMLRPLGSLSFWCWLAVVLVLIDCVMRRGVRRIVARMMLVILSAALAGGLANVLKVLIRRERPEFADGVHAFRPWSVAEPFDGTGMGLPSGHAAVAFGGAMALCLLYPRASPIWLLLATGCAATRVLVRAHFFSDVVLAALCGMMTGYVVWVMLRRWIERPGIGADGALQQTAGD